MSSKRWKDVKKSQIKEGRAEGRAKAQAELIDEMAFLKFGATPKLVGLLDYLKQIPDPERLVEVGEWLFECDSGEELLARAARLCEPSAAEDRAPRV